MESTLNELSSMLNTVEEYNAVRGLLLIRHDYRVAKEQMQNPKPLPKPYSPTELNENNNPQPARFTLVNN
jgi:hypothetical protein